VSTLWQKKIFIKKGSKKTAKIQIERNVRHKRERKRRWKQPKNYKERNEYKKRNWRNRKNTEKNKILSRGNHANKERNK
jgi:hypothetical protein